MDGRIPGQYLRASVADVGEDSPVSRVESMDSRGLQVAHATTAGSSGWVQPEGSDLQHGREKGSILRSAEDLQGVGWPWGRSFPLVANGSGGSRCLWL